MRLKNILIVVSDMERSKNFYHDIFGLQIISDFGENVILTEGLVLQKREIWEQILETNTVTGNASELFFEENNLDEFLYSLEEYQRRNPGQIKVCSIRRNSWGKRAVLLSDPDGHLIEVAEVKSKKE